MLRILFWTPFVNPGGGVRLLQQLVEAVARQPDVSSVTLAVPVGSMPGMLVNTSNDSRLKVFELTKERKKSGLQQWLMSYKRTLGIKGTARLKRLIAQRLVKPEPNWLDQQFWNVSRDCDLVYVFWPHGQMKPASDKPMVCTIQDVTYFNFPEILGGTETGAEWKRLQGWLSDPSKIVVSSNSTKDALVKIFGKQFESVVIIRHDISPVREGHPAKENSALLTQLPEQYVIYPANTTSHKNHYQLLIAWARFARHKEYPLVLCGSDTELLNMTLPELPNNYSSNRLAGAVLRNQLRAGVDFYALGYVSDNEVMTLISRATALIMPSLSEGGGSFPVEEALSVGVPVLCSDIPVMREVLEGRSAKVAWFDPESPNAIVDAMNALLQNYDEYKQSAVRAAADPRSSWNDVAAQYANVFRQVVSAENRDVSRQ